jgi:transcriptional regulator with XRE-family HTH domain
MTIGQRLRNERNRRGISQVSASVEAQISIGTWSNTERGCQPAPSMIERMEGWISLSQKEAEK